MHIEMTWNMHSIEIHSQRNYSNIESVRFVANVWLIREARRCRSSGKRS